MADSSRIEDLRRRVQKDPASIAFAQLAEELRRAGQLDESIAICRAGLILHPGYLSARVTLGRALIELNQLDEAQAELEHVLASAPENLAAIRGLAEIAHRSGNLASALGHYRAALGLARNDPDLQETVQDLSKKVEPPAPSALTDGLSLEQVTRELFLRNPVPALADAPAVDFFGTLLSQAAPAADAAPPQTPASDHSEPAHAPADASAESPTATPESPAVSEQAPTPIDEADPIGVLPIATVTTEPDPGAPAPDAPVEPDVPRAHAPAAPTEPVQAEALDSPETRTFAVLERWLEAIHVTRDPHGT